MDHPPAADSRAVAGDGVTGPTDSTATMAAVSEPTVVLPQARIRGSQTASDRWLRGLVVAGVVTFAVLVTSVAAMLFTGGNAAQKATPPVTVAPTTNVTPELTTEASPSSTTTGPAPSSTNAAPPPGARQRQGPAELIAGIRGGLTQLVRDGQLDAGAAKDLDKRLEDTSRALAEGDTGKASDKLRDAAQKASNLRDEGKLTATGYQALAAALSQLAQAFPPR